MSNLSNIKSLDIEDVEKDKEKMINIKSKDDVLFNISLSNAIISKLIEVMTTGDKDETEIPIVGIHSDVLKIVVDYMNKKKGFDTIVVSKPLLSSLSDSCSDEGKWEAEFILNLTHKQVSELIFAANYMEINSLLNICCARVGFELKSKSESQMISIIKKYT